MADAGGETGEAIRAGEIAGGSARPEYGEARASLGGMDGDLIVESGHRDAPEPAFSPAQSNTLRRSLHAATAAGIAPPRFFATTLARSATSRNCAFCASACTSACASAISSSVASQLTGTP